MTPALVLDRIHAIGAAETPAQLSRALKATGLADYGRKPWGDVLAAVGGHDDDYWSLRWLPGRVRTRAGLSMVDLLARPSEFRKVRGAFFGGEQRLLELLSVAFANDTHSRLTAKLMGVAEQEVRALHPPPGPRDSLARYLRWLQAFGLQGLLEVQSGHLLVDPRDRVVQGWLQHRGEWTVEQALKARISKNARSWAPRTKTLPLGVREALRSALSEAILEDALAAQEPPPPVDLSEEEWPELVRARRAVDERLRALAAQVGRTWSLTKTQGTLRVALAPPRLQWSLGNAEWYDSWSAELRFSPLRAGSPEGQQPSYRWERAALRAAQGMLSLEGVRRLDLRPLEVDLGLRPVDRLLTALLPEPGTDRLGWGLREDKEGLWLSPLWCSEGPRGGVKTRLARWDSIEELLLVAEELDERALAELLGGDGLDTVDGQATYRSRLHRPAGVAAALSLLSRHPRLFIQLGRDRPLRVVRRELELRVDREAGGVAVTLRVGGEDLPPGRLHQIAGHGLLGAPLLLLDREDAVATLVPVSSRQRRIAQALIRHGRRFDSEAEDDLIQRLPQLQPVVPLTLDEALEGDPVPADERMVVRLETVAGGLTLAMWTRPLPGAGVRLPGRGTERCYGTQDGERVHAVRDLDQERRRVVRLAEALELPPPDVESTPLWLLEDGEDAASALSALRGRDGVVVEWQGRASRVRTSGGFDQLSVSFKPIGAWFGVQGQLATEDGPVDLADLLLAIEQGRRFVRLGDGDWLELDATLRSGLTRAAGGLRGGLDGTLSPLHAPVLEELRDQGATFDAPASWWEKLDAIDAASKLVPPVPDGLKAELRPYQVDGFRWLARLAEWSGGAVLADDMGLGKTVQALALLLRRADGPALVVGPASVGWNWITEAERFAPSLSLREYRGPKRAALLDGLGAGDVLVTSWDLLARDVEALSDVSWSTVVFDEAQAMKNPVTRRNKAARALDAGFRLALTGTPAENHAGELHAIMSVVLPGLLGSREQFRHRFLGPLSNGDDTARRILARLIAPFVLRRLKRDVAQDLPDRIEVERVVELSPTERRIYERVRKSGLAQLALAEETGDMTHRMRVLALLTRLRLAACHPRLAEPDSNTPSSKLAEAVDLLESLRQEGHAVLVFSQFVKHLELVREELQRRDFRLAWLTGATPTTRRRAEVDRFQAREADVFLISIKAGGTGLNLTAATYVIHLDPWWNPAVEDQATDRAHRIGQTRAVTVYRFVCRDTVEEQILEMHARKRELVEGLLAGTGSSAALSTDQLVELLSSGGAPLPEDDVGAGIEAPEPPIALPAPNPEPSVAAPKKPKAIKKRTQEAARPPAAAEVIEAEVVHTLADLRRARTLLHHEMGQGPRKSSPATQKAYAAVSAELLRWFEHEGLSAGSPAELEASYGRLRVALTDGSWPGRRTAFHVGGTVLRRMFRLL